MVQIQSAPDVVQTLGLDPASGYRKRWRQWLLLTLLLLSLVAAVMAWARARTTGAPSYKTQAVQRGNLTVTVTATGDLEPTNQVEVGSELSGIIRTVDVDYNDWVKVGQVLAKLDTDQLQANKRSRLAARQSRRMGRPVNSRMGLGKWCRPLIAPNQRDRATQRRFPLRG